MNNNNLSSILQQNRAFLGDKYEKIGKNVSSSFFSRKILLSHDKETGWNIVKLNPLQLFFRNFLGLYRNTHLKHIYKRLSKEEIQREQLVNSSFYSHISEIWAEKCLKWVGNAPLSEAQIFCFGENHGDIAYRTVVQQFINENYHEGDVILIEGIEANKVVKTSANVLTKDLKDNCLVMGWEPQNFKKINQEPLKLHREKIQEIQNLIEQFNTAFPENCLFTESEIPLLKENLESIGNKILELNQYFQSKDKDLLNVKEIFSTLLKEVIEQKFTRDVLGYFICDMSVKLEKEQENALHKNITIEAQKQIIKNAPLRDVSLIQEISKNRDDGKRVFVIGGLAHFLQSPYTATKNQVKAELFKHQFVVLGRKNKIDECYHLNRDLPQIVKK